MTSTKAAPSAPADLEHHRCIAVTCTTCGQSSLVRTRSAWASDAKWWGKPTLNDWALTATGVLCCPASTTSTTISVRGRVQSRSPNVNTAGKTHCGGGFGLHQLGRVRSDHRPGRSRHAVKLGATTDRPSSIAPVVHSRRTIHNQGRPSRTAGCAGNALSRVVQRCAPARHPADRTVVRLKLLPAPGPHDTTGQGPLSSPRRCDSSERWCGVSSP